MLPQIKRKKRGVSIMVGYVLLVTLAIIMGGILYVWMQSYIPREPLACPDGTSLIIKDSYYNCSEDILNLTLKNNGRFDIGGYFIHVSNNPDITLPTIDISASCKNFDGTNFTLFQNSVIFPGDITNNSNTLNPGKEVVNWFDVSCVGEVYYVQVIPT